MKFRPLHDRVVVRRIDNDEKTSGGIIIPDTAQEKPQEGEIVAVGPGARDDDGERPEPSVHASRGIGQFRHGRNIPDGFSRVPLITGGAHPGSSGRTRSRPPQVDCDSSGTQAVFG